MYSKLVTLLLVVLSQNINSQQILNLDFEKTSIEHPNRPWGWSTLYDCPVATSLDSITKRSGKYSLHLSKAENSNQEHLVLECSLEPFELKGKTIELKGWNKTSLLNGDGDIRVSLASIRKVRTKEIYSQSLTGEGDWSELSVKTTIPESTDRIDIKIYFKGNGEAWLDDFRLIVDGEIKNSISVAPDLTQEQFNWIANNSVPLMQVDPSLTASQKPIKTSAMQYFETIVAGARIIALGESTHGTSEFFRLKHRLLDYAVNEMNVRIFAMEGNMLTIKRINEYVQNGQGSAQNSMNGIFMVWYNEEVLQMIEWVREYNSLNPNDPVQFVGYDIQEVIPPIDSLQSFLKKYDLQLYSASAKFLEELRNNGGYGVAASSSKKQRRNWYKKAKSLLKKVKKSTKIEKGKEDISHLNEILWGIQYANLVKQFTENTLRGHLSFYRDKAMAENISWFLNNSPDSIRMLVWAHDYHVSRGDFRKDKYNIYNGLSMGNWLSKEYGTDYKSFALSTYEGSYRGMVSYFDFTQKECPLHPSPQGTLDYALHQLSNQKKVIGMLLDLSSGHNQNWLLKPLKMRFANHVNIEYGYWVDYVLPKQFDGIFFVNETSPSQPLK